jgi:hypothetical protein
MSNNKFDDVILNYIIRFKNMLKMFFFRELCIILRIFNILWAYSVIFFLVKKKLMN